MHSPAVDNPGATVAALEQLFSEVERSAG
jgi:hypothetical protein